MAFLPVPASQYFSDFSFDLVEYTIIRGNESLGTAKGLTNTDGSGQYVSFLIGIDLRVGDVLQNGSTRLEVTRLSLDSYNGEDQMVNAYYR